MGFNISQKLGGSKHLKAARCGAACSVHDFLSGANEEIGQDKEHKLVVWFAETEKGLVFNKINGETISEIVGDDDSDSWADQKVVLFADKTDFGGRRVDCIRVRAPRGKSCQEQRESR